MQPKVSKPGPSVQTSAETPEQKEIQLLKKRLDKAKKDSDGYRQLWLESEEKYEKVATSASTNYYLARASQTQVDGLLIMNKIANESASRWEAECKRLKEEASLGVDKIGRSNDTREWLLNLAGGALGKILEPDKYSEPEEIEKPYKAEIKVKLICINPGPVTTHHPDGRTKELDPVDDILEELARYTSPGLVSDEDGFPCYPINELDGELKAAERFYVSTKTQKTRKPRQKRD